MIINIINCNWIIMKWIFFVTVLFTQIVSAQAMIVKANKPQRIELHSQQDTFLKINEPGYYRGFIRSQSHMEHVIAFNSAGDPIKKLLNHEARETEIFWYVDEAYTYRIEMKSADTEASKAEMQPFLILPSIILIRLAALLRLDESIN
ncbi:hypothetical protein VSWAT3_02306 [Vibrionales bacterium SWAT-3]|nr:hypothetical protein VSWAT3_02306 [Vibrionales bacterium SWAT-3]